MIISLISFLAVFTVIVLVHEFGHFIAARKAGVKVYEFSIGFPFSPKIITLFRHKETEFTLRLLPLGGFVSFSKEGEGESIDLFNASYFNRALIMSAGSAFNILFAFLIFILVFVFGKHYPLSEAILMSANTVWAVFAGTAGFFFDLFSGNGTAEGLVGPLGIASLAGKAAVKGFISLLYFSGLLSISLGIINLLPMPALDGGHLFMLLIEAMRRKPLSLKIHQTVSVVGILLFIILTVFVTYRDIVRLVA